MKQHINLKTYFHFLCLGVCGSAKTKILIVQNRGSARFTSANTGNVLALTTRTVRGISIRFRADPEVVFISSLMLTTPNTQVRIVLSM